MVKYWNDGKGAQAGDAGAKSSGEQQQRGRVIAGETARQVLTADGIKPDFDYALRPPLRANGSPSPTVLDYIHRATGDTDIYLVVNRSNCWEEADCTFRVAGKAPELWDPLTGDIRPAAVSNEAEGRTTLRLQFAPYGSIFVVFRKAAMRSLAAAPHANFRTFQAGPEVAGPWTVHFDPKWGGPNSVVFDRLSSWTQRPEEGIKYYSGTATYQTTFDLPEGLRRPGERLTLDLGDVKELAEVHLNGKNLGVVWALPFRVDVTTAIKPSGNRLEIEVVNFWPNRIIGDQFLPPEKRFTRTNIRKLTKDTPLMESGLLGPVRLLVQDR